MIKPSLCFQARFRLCLFLAPVSYSKLKTSPIGHVYNIPTIRFITRISRNTQSKSYMLSLTECVWEIRNNALWDTHQHALLVRDSIALVSSLLLSNSLSCLIMLDCALIGQELYILLLPAMLELPLLLPAIVLKHLQKQFPFPFLLTLLVPLLLLPIL